MYNTSRDKKKTSAFDIETHPLLIVIIYRYTVLVILDLLEMDTSARVKSYTSHLMPHSLYDVCITANHCVNIVYHEFLYTLLGSFQTSAEMLRIPPTVAMKTLCAKIPMYLRSVYVNLDSVGMNTIVQKIINYK